VAVAPSSFPEKAKYDKFLNIFRVLSTLKRNNLRLKIVQFSEQRKTKKSQYVYTEGYGRDLLSLEVILGGPRMGSLKSPCMYIVVNREHSSKLFSFEKTALLCMRFWR